jgi:NAD(P)-dependent dehydrogenase (short-subunit alcohol dehydrogenase family)/acyl carrier protein
LRSAGQFPDRIVHLWNVGNDAGEDAAQPASPDAVAAMQEISFYSLMHLAQALARSGANQRVQLDVVATGLHDITGSEPLTPAKATLLGPCIVIPQEQPQINCRSIDIALSASGVEKVEAHLWAELHAKTPAQIVALRGRHRWVQNYEEMPLPPLRETLPLLRPGGVYLITGGLGGIGLALAEMLAQRVRAKLVLIARTPLPARAHWAAWLADHGEDDATSRKIRIVQALEAQGSEVLTLAADVVDLAQMRNVVAMACAQFGAIHGVIHAAGISYINPLAYKTRAEAERVLAPKVMGTAVLDQSLAGQTPDFVVLCSSVGSMLGGFGQIDYTAANIYLDAFAHARSRQDSAKTIAINYARWQEVGMAFNAEVAEEWRDLKEEQLRNGLRTAEGQETFLRILANPLPQVVVSPEDLLQLLRRTRSVAGASVLPTGVQDAASSTQPSGTTASQHSRPALQTAYVAPRNDLEAQIADVWQQLFGIDQIGVYDNFFELGGHSLMATQVLVRLRDHFGIDLPVRTIFEAHTVAELASQLEIILWAAESRRSAVAAVDEDREELEF